MDNMSDLLNTVAGNMSAEEIALAGIQSLIAAEISIKRQKLKMNQQQFSEYMGVSQSMISKWESGECNYTLETLVRIASKLGFEMQCPFVLEKPKTYKHASFSNIYSLDDYRKSLHSTYLNRTSFTVFSSNNILKEM